MLPIPEKIVVAGLNVEGLLTALQLRLAYQANITKISVIGQHSGVNNDAASNNLIKSEALVIGKGLNSLLASYGYSEQQRMPLVCAQYKVRRVFSGWGPANFSIANKCAVDTLNIPLMMEISKIKRERYAIDFNSDDFFFCNYLAEQKRIPKGKDFPFPVEYQYQVDSAALETLLVTIANDNKVSVNDSEIQSITLDGVGNIKTIEVAGASFDGDYFFDCTQLQRLIASNLSDHENEKLPLIRNNDQFIKAIGPVRKTQIETQCYAVSNGFVDVVASAKFTEYRYYFSTQVSTQEASLQIFGEFIRRQGLPENMQMTLHASGEYFTKQPWIKNCISLGQSSGHSQLARELELDVLLNSVMHFVDSIQQDTESGSAVEQFNSRIKTYFSYLHSFSQTLILINNRRDSKYWQTPQDLSAMHPLCQPIFVNWLKAEDLTSDPIFDIVGVNAWYSLFAGLGHYPQDGIRAHEKAKSIADNINDVKEKLTGCCLNFAPLEFS